MTTAQLIALQVNFPDLLQADELTTGIAIVIIGMFLALTLITLLFRTVVIIVGWSITTIMMILVFLSAVPVRIYFLTYAISVLGFAMGAIIIVRARASGG